MKNLSDKMEEIELKMYEIECLIKCIRDILDCSIVRKDDFSYIYPIAEIVCQKFDILNDDYSELSSKIYRKFIIAE